MGNCLVTKLKESVNNDNLSKLGELKFSVTKGNITNPNQQELRLSTNDKIHVRVNGNGGFAKSVAELSTPLTDLDIYNTDGEVTLYFINDDYNVFISNKESIVNLKMMTVTTILSVNSNEFAGATSLETLFANMVGDIKYLKYSSSLADVRLPLQGSTYGNLFEALNPSGATLALFNSPENSYTGDVSESNLTRIETFVFDGSKIVGDIANLPPMNYLAVLSINSDISGTVESFVAKQKQGRATLTNPISMSSLLNTISFGGNKYQENYAQYLLWDDHKIVVYAGSSDYTLAPRIYAKDATAQEIEAWQAAGKTVTDVVSGTVYPPANA